MEKKNYKFETLQVRAGQEIDPVSKGTAVPIYQSTAYTFDSMEYGAELFELKRAGNIYTRITNTTSDVFEKRMAALEGGVAAVATASGQSAVFLSITNICGPGDNIVAQPFLYGGTFTMFAITLRDMGIQVRFAKSDKVEDLEPLIDERTKAIYLENLGNPAFNIPDYEPIAELARKKGICVMVDNTFGMGGYLFRPFEWAHMYRYTLQPNGSEDMEQPSAVWLSTEETSTGLLRNIRFWQHLLKVIMDSYIRMCSERRHLPDAYAWTVCATSDRLRHRSTHSSCSRDSRHYRLEPSAAATTLLQWRNSLRSIRL